VLGKGWQRLPDAPRQDEQQRMIIPDNIAEPGVAFQDQYFDLRGLSLYSSLGVGTLRDYLRGGSLPHYKMKGKILIKRSEFDDWIQRFRQDKKTLNSMVNEIMNNLKKGKSD